jgi:membrane-associated phospholipid phosphatase
MEKDLPLTGMGERLVLLSVVSLFLGGLYEGVRFLPHRASAVVAWDPVRFVPCVGIFVVPYVLAFLVAAVVVQTPFSRADFRRFLESLCVAELFSVLCFWLLPLLPPRVTTLGDGILDRALALVYALDVNGNCFPSLHVSLSFLAALAVGRCRPRLRAVMLLWATLVAVSTVFVHQHYVIDMVGGIALALVLWKFFFSSPASR